jgi:hypothetical protein
VLSGLLALLVVSGCGQSAEAPREVAAATEVESPTEGALESPTVVPTAAPTATPLPEPSSTPVPQPSPTPVAQLALSIAAQLDPATPRAGDEFVLSLTVANGGNRPAQGVYIATTGPWDQWTLLDIQPSGMLAQDEGGWHIVSDIQIAPGDSGTLELHLRADQPAQEQLTFAVREAQPDELEAAQ